MWDTYAYVQENDVAKTKKMLEQMSSPKEWLSAENEPISVETPFTTRAKELVTLYNGLSVGNLSRPQRVDVLLHVKYVAM